MQEGPISPRQQFKEFTDSLFSKPLLNEIEFEQLSWRLGSLVVTPEKAILDTSKDRDCLEAKRCLTRLHCLELLHRGEGTYNDFIVAQAKDDPYSPVLEFQQYQNLCAHFAQMDLITFQTLRVATIISSVTLSENAKQKANEILGEGNYTFDSVEFLADTFRDVQKARQIYSLVDALFSEFPTEADQEKIASLLQAAFASRCHYRHMLYTEGNENMFVQLLANVKSGTWSHEAFEFWKSYWTINITGFRGHINHEGSLYLNSNTFRAMRALESVLEQVFSDEVVYARDILNDYLDKRAGDSFIQLQDLPGRTFDADERRLLAHVASMMRLFHPEEGEALIEGYRLIPKTVMKNLKAAYFNAPEGEPTPTYTPALFENGIDFRKQSYQKDDSILKQVHDKFFGVHIKILAEKLIRLVAIADVVVTMLPLNLKALESYRQRRVSGRLQPNQPLSFFALANKKEVTEICGESPIFKQYNILRYADVGIDEKGGVHMRPKPRGRQKASSSSDARYYTPGYCDRQTRSQKAMTMQAEEVRERQSPAIAR